MGEVRNLSLAEAWDEVEPSLRSSLGLPGGRLFLFGVIGLGGLPAAPGTVAWAVWELDMAGLGGGSEGGVGSWCLSQ